MAARTKRRARRRLPRLGHIWEIPHIRRIWEFGHIRRIWKPEER